MVFLGAPIPIRILFPIPLSIAIAMLLIFRVSSKKKIFIGLSFAILAAIFWWLEGVIIKYCSMLSSNKYFIFLCKISIIIIFLPFTWAIIHSVNMFILLLTLIIGIIGYIADLS